LDEILLDRGFYAKEVRAEIDGRDLLYTMPMPKYEPDYRAKIKSKDGVDAAVDHDSPVGIDGDVDHTAECLYVPATSDDAEGQYAVFVTARTFVRAVVSHFERSADLFGIPCSPAASRRTRGLSTVPVVLSSSERFHLPASHRRIGFR